MGIKNFSKKQLSSLAGLSIATVLVVSVLSIIPTEDNQYIIAKDVEALSGGGFNVVLLSSSFTVPVVQQQFTAGVQQDDLVQCLVTYTVGHSFTDTVGNADTVTIKFIFKDTAGNIRTQIIAQDYAIGGGIGIVSVIDGLFGGFLGIGGGGGNTITVPVVISGVSGSENIVVEAKLSGGTTFLWTLRNPPCFL